MNPRQGEPNELSVNRELLCERVWHGWLWACVVYHLGLFEASVVIALLEGSVSGNVKLLHVWSASTGQAVTTHIDRHCGVQDDMAADGYQDIMSIDYSPVCVKQLGQWNHRPACKFAVADVRSMPQFPDTSFQSVIDKGTLDSLLCGPSSFTEAHDALAEVDRVLRPGGSFLVVTYGMPKERLRHLQEHDWEIQTYTIEKRCVQPPVPMWCWRCSLLHRYLSVEWCTSLSATWYLHGTPCELVISNGNC